MYAAAQLGYRNGEGRSPAYHAIVGEFAARLTAPTWVDIRPMDLEAVLATHIEYDVCPSAELRQKARSRTLSYPTLACTPGNLGASVCKSNSSWWVPSKASFPDDRQWPTGSGDVAVAGH